MQTKEETVKNNEEEVSNDTTSDTNTESGGKLDENQASKEKNKSFEEMEKQTREELVELKDRHIRLVAEFDNYKRRTLREQTKFQVTANEKAVKEMLSVEDNFERAEKEEVLSEGMEIVRKDLITSLAKLGVKKIECVDQKFDADIHEALTQVPNEEKKGLIIDVVENGYLMGEKVIRFPKVIIGC